MTGFKDDLGRAQHGLRRQQSGEFPRQTHFYAAFRKRFQNDVKKSRATAGKSGDGVHMLLVNHHGFPHGIEKLTRDFEMLGRGVLAFADGGDAFTDHGWRVGHGANDRHFRADASFKICGRNGSGNGNDELFRI